MSKISTYEVVPIPKLSDKLIGTSVGGEIEDVTYNFTLQELLQLFIPNIPANTLQGILDYGNTATQDINLFGKITTTNLEVTDTANLFNTYLNEEVHIVGKLFDSDDSFGTPGQFLISTGAGVSWYTMPIYIPTLQEVLTAGDVSDVDIILDANIEALDISVDTAHIAENLYVLGKLTDGFSSFGTNGQVLSSTGAGVKWTDLPSYSALSPLLFNPISGVFSIQQANSSQGGYLSSVDWINFDGKQNAGNYITALTGEAVALGPGSASVTLNNAAVISKVLSGLNIMGGSISATDNILTAFGKVQNQINGLLGGVVYQGTWNAASNSPTLVSSVGVQGHYYVVNVAGSTNLNGVSNWQVGDWAIFNGGTWQKVDNTDAVISVNGFTGIVELVTDNVPEGLANLYFTNARARNALSATSPLIYDNFTGTFTIQQANGSQDGYLSSTDWTTFNSKQNALSGTGLVKSTGGTISYITDNSSNWNTAYNDSIVSAAVTGTTTKTLTLNQQDGGTVTASWTESPSGLTSVGLSMPAAFTVSNSPLTSNGTINVVGAGTSGQYVRGDGSLGVFPTVGGGGGGSVYYLNGNTSQGSIGGTTMYQLSKTPGTGSLASFSRSTVGTIASFITDVGDPNQLTVPSGIWLFHCYLSESGGGSNAATVQAVVEKWDGVTVTVIGTGIVEEITNGSVIDLYTFGVTIPSGVTLSLTDRIVVQIQIANPHGKTVTLYTENSDLSSVVTTFPNGISSLNGLTAAVQAFGTGTSGTDFNIASTGSTHTFNIPTSSVTNRGLLSPTDWSTFNGKQDALTLTTTGTSGAATLIGSTLNIPQYSGTNIYNSNGTITGARVLTLGGNPLDIAGTTTTRFFANGRVGIGTTTDAGFQFDVNGTARINNNLNFTNGGSINFDLGASPFFNSFIRFTNFGGGTVQSEISTNSWRAAQPITLRASLAGNNDLTISNNFSRARGQIQVGNADNSISNGFFSGFVLELGTSLTNSGVYQIRTVNPTTFPSAQNDLYIYGGVGSGNVAGDLFLQHNTTAKTGNVIIGTNVRTASAILSIASTTQGFLPPRMTSAQVAAISTPAAGLIAYDTTNNELDLYNGTAWVPLATGNIYSANGTLTGARVLSLGGNPLDIAGTTTTRFFANGRLGIGTTTDGGFQFDVNGISRFQGQITGSGGNFFRTANNTANWFSDGNNPLRIIASAGTLNINNSALIQCSGVDLTTITSTVNPEGFPSTIPVQYNYVTSGTLRNLNSINRVFIEVKTTGGGSVSNAPLLEFFKVQRGNVTGYTRFVGLSIVDCDVVFNSTSGSTIIGGSTINASAKFQIDTTTQGFLPPRMTAAQASAIVSPAEGLMVYVTNTNATFTTKGWWGFNGAIWERMNN